MNLGEAQAAFMAQVLDEEAPLPKGWNARHRAGMGVYRNNYRSALVEALRSTFEKTARWTGEDAFRRAAAHHLITHPPTSWTLDDAGAGFDRTCADLFAKDPEVAELAWLEWAMQQAFTAANADPLSPQQFADQTAGFGEDDWAALRLAFLPGACAREVEHDLRRMWNALGEDEFERPDPSMGAPRSVLVWREGERSTFLMGNAEDARAFAAIQQGAPYGEVCVMMAGENPGAEAAQDAAMRAGAMLGKWLHEGLVAAIRR